MSAGKVRIIAGKWRSRKIDVIDVTDLRPTPDRVRETLFNWLSPYIEGASCLDLFAGSGILGFEALSRGAASVTMVDSSLAVVKALQVQAIKLVADGTEIVCADALTWLGTNTKQFDIIFLDPPFSKKLLGNVISQLLHYAPLHSGTLLYTESDEDFINEDPRLRHLKQGKASMIHFNLFEYSER